MSGRLQEFGFKKSQYERPTQKWLCGWTEEGRSCPLGPDAHGHCRDTFECTPRRKGDRWQCTRSPVRGGSCDDGPRPDGQCSRTLPPCQPVHAIRPRRGLVSLWAGGLSLGVITLLLIDPDRRATFTSPGPLARSHGALDVKCSQCHTGTDSDGGWTSWLASIGDAAATNAQDQKCMTCHSMGQDALSPHGLPTDALAAITARLVENEANPGSIPLGLSLANWIHHRGEGTARSWSCAACHREHHGRDHDLKALADASCQVCHRSQFTSFSSDHPPFSAYPYRRRSRLRFDHASHRDQHFEDRAFDCAACHRPDAAGVSMRLGSFETACASCHQGDVDSVALPEQSLAMLRVPGLDADEWPVDALGNPTAFMMLLLSGDDEHPIDAATWKELIETGGELLDLDADVVETTMEPALKKLLADLGRTPLSTVQERLQRSLGTAVTREEALPLASGFSLASWNAARQRWFAEEYRSGEDDATAEEGVPPGGWFAKDGDLSFRYQPTGHADPLVRAWLDVAAGAYGADENRNAVLDHLFNTMRVGLCRKCHSTDRLESGQLRVNWHAGPGDASPNPFTRFSHAPHITGLGTTSCESCHRITSDSKFLAFFRYGQEDAMPWTDVDPYHRFVSGFDPLQRTDCAACHRASGAGENCTQCHRYHAASTGQFMTYGGN